MSRIHLVVGILLLVSITTALSQGSYFAEFGDGIIGEGPAIIPTSDGGAVIGITTGVSATEYRPAFSDKKPGIIRIDQTGKIIQGHSYKGYMTGALIPAPDSTLMLLAAETIIRIAADGSVVECRAIEVAPSVSLVYHGAIPTRDSGALLLGWMQPRFSSTSSLFLTKINRNGAPQWTAQTGGIDANGPCSGVQLKDGRFIIGAYTTWKADDHYNDRVAALLELSESGEILSTRIIDRIFSSVSIKLLRNDRDEVLAMVTGHGRSSGFPEIKYTGILMLLDTALQPKWSRQVSDAVPIDIGFEGNNPLILVKWWTPRVSNWEEEKARDTLSTSERIEQSRREWELRTRYFLAALDYDGNVKRLSGLPADSGRNEYQALARLSSGAILCLGTRRSREERYAVIGIQGRIDESDCWGLPASDAPPFREIPLPTLIPTEWEQQEGEKFKGIKDKTTLSPLQSTTTYFCRDKNMGKSPAE